MRGAWASQVLVSTLNLLLRESGRVPRSERMPCPLCARGAPMLTYVALAERSDGMPADYLTSRFRVGAATACLACTAPSGTGHEATSVVPTPSLEIAGVFER